MEFLLVKVIQKMIKPTRIYKINTLFGWKQKQKKKKKKKEVLKESLPELLGTGIIKWNQNLNKE